jgi:cathepsin L
MAAAYAYGIMSTGINNSTVYPYTELQGNCRFNATLSKVELSSFVTLPTPDEEILKDALAVVGPISVRADNDSVEFLLI